MIWMRLVSWPSFAPSTFCIEHKLVQLLAQFQLYRGQFKTQMKDMITQMEDMHTKMQSQWATTQEQVPSIQAQQKQMEHLES